VPSRESDASIDDRMFYIAHDETTLAVSKMIERDGMSVFDWIATGKQDPDPKSGATLDLEKLAAFVESENPSITKLEAALDEALQFVPESDDVAREVAVGNLTSLK
jgi:hypothetical protein